MADEELLKEFFTDTQAHIDSIEEAALNLEKDPAQPELINDIFRSVHSVKGNAGMLGLSSVHAEGQKFEDFMDNVRERGSATAEEMERVFADLDRFKALINRLREEKGMPPDTAPAIEETTAPEPPAAPGSGAGTDDKKSTAPRNQAPPPSGPSGQQPAPPTPAKPAPDQKHVQHKETSETFLVFGLAGETYGIDILSVREIITTETITRVPNTKPFVEGVMNLRDQVIPVFDMKKRLDIRANGGKTEEKNTIIVEVSGVSTGLKVDDVLGIIKLDYSKITSPDTFQGSVSTEYMRGVGRTEDGAIILLEVTELCGQIELLY